MLKYPNIQCFIEKLTRNDDDWLILRLDELVVGKILETVMNHQMNSWTDFEHCMENVTIDDLNGQQFETGRFVFCAIIYEPFQLLPDFIKTQDMTVSPKEICRRTFRTKSLFVLSRAVKPGLLICISSLSLSKTFKMFYKAF